MSRSKRRKRPDKPKKMIRKNTIIDCTKNVPNLNKVLNQFICEECFCVSLVAEEDQNETPKYVEKQLLCSHCEKKTLQICIKDREFTKSILSMSKDRTKKEEKAFQMIKRSRRRSSK